MCCTFPGADSPYRKSTHSKNDLGGNGHDHLEIIESGSHRWSHLTLICRVRAAVIRSPCVGLAERFQPLLRKTLKFMHISALREGISCGPGGGKIKEVQGRRARCLVPDLGADQDGLIPYGESVELMAGVGVNPQVGYLVSYGVGLQLIHHQYPSDVLTPPSGRRTPVPIRCTD